MLGTVRLAYAGDGAARAHSCVGRVRALSQSQSQRPRSQIQLAGRLSDYRTAHSGSGASQDAGRQKKPFRQPWQRPHSKPRLQKLPFIGPSHVDQLGRLLQVTPTKSSIDLSFEHQDYSHISHLWFRDACPCAHCVSESSGQKNFATCDIDATPELESSKVLEDGSLELVWARDFMGGGSHTSVYPLSLLQRFLVHNRLPAIHRPERYLWDRAAFEKNMTERTISYDAWMAGGEPFANGLMDLAQWGLIIIKGVPETRDAVKDIANRIGVLQSTFYGDTWDVISKPDAENVAYTNEFLCLHQDLMYYRDSPYVQLLHCMNNDCEGGDSLFSDGLRAGAEFKYQRPQDYAWLKRQRVTFQYSRNGNFYQQSKPVIHEGSGDNDLPQAIQWSPPFQGMFSSVDSTAEAMVAWRNAAKAFKNSLEAPENMLQYRMQPGDCILFDNSRVLHGRTKFDTSSGHRHLHGAYLQKQTLMSALNREFGEHKLTIPRMACRREEDQAITMYGKAARGGESAEIGTN